MDRSYHQSLIESLQDPYEAEAYLEAAMEEGEEAATVALQNLKEAGTWETLRKPPFVIASFGVNVLGTNGYGLLWLGDDPRTTAYR